MQGKALGWGHFQNNGPRKRRQLRDIIFDEIFQGYGLVIFKVESRFQILKSRQDIMNIIVLLEIRYQVGMGVREKVLGKAQGG